MKKFFAVLVVFSLIAFSGCVQSEEDQAIQLADSTSEVKLVLKLFNSFSDIDKCSADEMASILAGEGVDVPELTEEQRQEFEQLKAGVAFCKPSITKAAEKESENVYLVSYSMEFSQACGGELLNAEEPFRVRVNLSNGKAEPIDGGLAGADIAEAEEVIDKLGNCSALVFWGAVSGFGG